MESVQHRVEASEPSKDVNMSNVSQCSEEADDKLALRLGQLLLKALAAEEGKNNLQALQNIISNSSEHISLDEAPKDKAEVEPEVSNVWCTFVFKSLDEDNVAAVTYLCGAAGATDDERAVQLRVNKASNDMQLRHKSAARLAYDTTMQFKERVVFEIFPFKATALVCEIELAETEALKKYNLSVPEDCLDCPELHNTNCVAFHDMFFGSDIMKGSQCVYVDHEMINLFSQTNDSVHSKSNVLFYHPRLFIRLLRVNNPLYEVLAFYVPYLIIWLAAYVCWYLEHEKYLLKMNEVELESNGAKLAAAEKFAEIGAGIIGLLLALISSSDLMMMGMSAYNRTMLFYACILLFAFMMIPAWHDITFFLPLLSLVWLVYAEWRWRQFKEKYVFSKKCSMILEEAGLQRPGETREELLRRSEAKHLKAKELNKKAFKEGLIPVTEELAAGNQKNPHAFLCSSKQLCLLSDIVPYRR